MGNKVSVLIFFFFYVVPLNYIHIYKHLVYFVNSNLVYIYTFLT